MNSSVPIVFEAPRLTFRHRLAAHFRRSMPSLATTVAGAGCWAAVMGISALAGLWARGWHTPGSFVSVVLLFALGAAIAFPVALTAARFVSLGCSAETAFAAAFLALSLATVGVTSALFALQYRQYYAAWHADFLTITWCFQLVFTMLTALVQFAVLGTRLFFPLGFLALFLASLWFVRQPR
ncbi:hypothetical protein SAZ10_13045 [Mesorhizobium sp. BAC0120]|uniref:hypothetical protein n=1 Tax=Mesorhizobium sp. BAC0120 TaxID=3090670 RepID=UPI00298CFB0C|nr:hypothetical protein [Mesorhizobium sp. BAC0120]MDW6022683.1 hypothetical protein [Mesorhizobium sp. BAC0120]